MDHIKSRLVKISNEIAFFCFSIGAESLQINITNLEKSYEMMIQCDINKEIDDELKKLKEQLDVPRREDVEEYLWELAGEMEGSRELSLVGMMIDDITISFNKPKLSIKMNRIK